MVLVVVEVSVDDVCLGLHFVEMVCVFEINRVDADVVVLDDSGETNINDLMV